MRFMGSKARIARQVKEVILKNVPSTEVTYWEPFMGGMNSFREIAPAFSHAEASDVHEDLALFWGEFLLGDFEPPEQVSEDEYRALREAEPSALRGFVGFGCSFGGKWFEGFARGGFNANGLPRVHPRESYRAVHRTKKKLTGASVGVAWAFYDEITPVPGDVVYCDPPYRGTTGYKNSFDHGEFWRWATRLSHEGVHVFVSEYQAPPGWVELWSAPLRKSVASAEDRTIATERVFKLA